MATNILMPALSPTMTEGTLARWLKKEGEPVKSGDVICEIETDKATMEFEAVDEGTIGRIMVAEGTQGVKVNTPIAVLLEEGESADATDSGGASGSASDRSGSAPVAENGPAKGYGGNADAPRSGLVGWPPPSNPVPTGG